MKHKRKAMGSPTIFQAMLWYNMVQAALSACPNRLVSGLGITLGQTPYHGSWSTLYAATEPSLQGKSFAYIGGCRWASFLTCCPSGQ